MKNIAFALALAAAACAPAAHVIEIDQPVMAAEEGLLLGNGDISVSVYQTADAIVFRFGKGDVWDRRMDFSDSCKPAHIREFIDGELKEGWKSNPFDNKATVATKGTKNEKRMKELCQGSSNVTKNWPYPCPKPVGELRMHLPVDLPGPMRIVQRVIVEEARLEIVCRWKNGVEISLEAVIPYDENVLSLKWKTVGWNEETFVGGNINRPVWFSLWRWCDPDFGEWAAHRVADYHHGWALKKAKANPKITPLPPPKTFFDGDVGCIEQSFYPCNLFKKGFKYRMSILIDREKCGRAYLPDLGGKTKDAYLHVSTSRGKGDGELKVAVTTSRDRTLAAPAAKSHAEYRKSTVEAAAADWAQRSFSAPGDEFLENLWYETCHARRCILKGGTVPPGLFFPSTVGDFSIWHGDYHANYNMQAIYWGSLTVNQTNQAAAYFDCVDFFRPIGGKIARDYYGARGCFIQLEGFPVLGDDDHNGNLPLGRMVYMTGWFPEKHFKWYKMTGDRQWLRDRGYPFIRDCALFYLDFLKKAPHPDLPPNLKDGKYHIFPSIQGESGFSGNPMDVCDKGQAIFHCRKSLWMAIEASKELGVDEELRSEWQERLDNLFWTHKRSDFKGENAAYAYYCYMAQEPEHGGRVWQPAEKWDGKPRKPGRNEPWYQGITTIWRIGMMRDNRCIPERDFPYLRNAAMKWRHANGLVWGMAIANYGRAGAWTETLSVMAPFQEMLLQSWDGSIRLFPRWPKDRDVEFSGWRAQGAFLVSAAMKGGRVAYFKVKSEKGEPCVVLGDWKVADRAGKAVSTSRDEFGRLVFNTVAGGEYSLK